jgi:hypothetical protein
MLFVMLVVSFPLVSISDSPMTEKRSVKSGDWDAADTWDPQGKPTHGDNVIIENKHEVTKDSDPEKLLNGSLTVRDGGKLIGKEPGDNIEISVGGDIINNGRIATKNATAEGESTGYIKLTGDDILNHGYMVTGDAQSAAEGTGANGGSSGYLTLEATGYGSSVINEGILRTGDAGDGADTNAAGENGGNGGQSGPIAVKSKENVVNEGQMETGDGGQGGSAGENAENGGDAGKVGDIDFGGEEIRSLGNLTTGEGKKGGDAAGNGKNGGNGSDAGGIKAHGPKDEDDEAEIVDIQENSKTEIGKPGGAGSGGEGGINGKSGAKGKCDVKADNRISMGPGAEMDCGLCSLEFGPGDLILAGIDEGAVMASGDVMILGQGLVDLTGNPPGVNVIQSVEGQIVFSVVSEDKILLNPGVELADITEPDATVIVAGQIPTVPEWGLIIFTLLLLTVGTIFIQRRVMIAGANGGTMQLSQPTNAPLFVPPVFAKVLAATITLALVGFATVVWLAGSITPTDAGGTLISAVIVAYMVHLWIASGNRSQ